MARGFRIGYGPPGTFSVSADGTSYVWSGKDSDLEYSEAGGEGNMGQIGNYASMNLATFPIYTIDVTHDDYGVMRTQGSDVGTGTDTLIASGWPIGGGAYVRITPPTTDGFERGINVGNIWRNATLTIQDLNIRWEWRGNSTFCSFNGSGPKFAIVHTSRTLNAANSAQDRPMFFLRPADSSDNNAYNRANTQVFGPGQGTTQGYGPLVYDDEFQPGGTLGGWPNGVMQWYYKNGTDGATTFQGVPLVPIDEAVTHELRIITTQTGSYPRGLIAYRLYRENGQVFEQGIPWDLAAVPFGAYIMEVQQFGMGEWNTAPTTGVTYGDVGTYITVARDLGGWLGRRNAA